MFPPVTSELLIAPYDLRPQGAAGHTEPGGKEEQGQKREEDHYENARTAFEEMHHLLRRRVLGRQILQLLAQHRAQVPGTGVLNLLDRECDRGEPEHQKTGDPTHLDPGSYIQQAARLAAIEKDREKPRRPPI